MNHTNWLRVQRRSWGFTQQEIAGLLGFASRTYISRLEHGKRNPDLGTALAYATLFGVPLGELFPQLVAEIQEDLRERVSRLPERPLDISTRAAERKRQLLQRLVQSEKEVNSARL